MARQRAFVVSHTHWDRAWYLTFQQYRVHLVEFVDELLDLLEREPAFRSFTLDGQMALVEDYLAIRPEARARIERLVRAGRLELGPWYVLPDAFLPSGEALIRNLRLGLRRARALGAVPRDGYMPDSFGHIAQMPMILRGFDLRSFLFMRGLSGAEWDRLGGEFRWRARDGSEVTAIYLRDGYLDASALGLPEQFGDFEGLEPRVDLAVQRVKASLAARQGRLPSGGAVLFNGCDHMPFQPQLPTLLDGVRAALPDVDLRHGTIGDYIDHVEGSGAPLPLHEGELLGNEHNPILSSVWSARVYLKLANHRAQWLLERVAEPLTVAAGTRGHALSVLVGEAWRLLLLNHAHDDICGCSIDAVHLDDVTRFREVEEIAAGVAAESVRELARGLGLRRAGSTQWLCAVRTSSVQTAELVEAEVFVPRVEGEAAPASVEVFDASGQRVATQMLAIERDAFRAQHLDAGWGTSLRFAFQQRQEPCSIAWLRVEPRAAEPAPHIEGGTQLENDDWRIAVDARGRFDVEHKPTRAILRDAIAFESTADLGDEYTYGPVPDEPPISTRDLVPTSVELAVVGPVLSELRVAWKIQSPRMKSAHEAGVVVVLRLRLARGSGAPTAHITVDNDARDHRLRIVFATAGHATTALAGGAFEVRARAIVHPETPESAPERYAAFPGEFEYPTQFSRDFVAVPGETATLVVAHRGLHEYELLEGERTQLAVTLLRCVGKLSRGDTRWRRVQAGPSLETPDAQCPGRHAFDLRIGLEAVGVSTADLASRALAWSQPSYVVQARLARFGDASSVHPATRRLVQIEGSDVELSALELDESGSRAFLRVWNRANAKRSVRIGLGEAALAGRTIVHVALCDLAGRERNELPLESGRVHVELAPHGLATLAFTFAAHA